MIRPIPSTRHFALTALFVRSDGVSLSWKAKNTPPY